MFIFSPTKLVVLFNSENETVEALKVDSFLWTIFDDVRRWTEGEYYDDRVVWLECFGIHPKCWSLDNIKKIGEQWGPVQKIDHIDKCIINRTYARILVRIKAQTKIDGRTRVLFGSGCCEVWVK